MQEFDLRSALERVGPETKARLVESWQRPSVDCLVFYEGRGSDPLRFVEVGPDCEIRSLNKALRTQVEGMPAKAFLKTVRMLMAEAEEKMQEVRGRIRLLEQEELALRERIRVGREHLEDISGAGANGTGPKIAKEDLIKMLNAIRAEEQRVETLRRQMEEERRNLDERESQILEVEETLIDRLNQISVRETELEQREENLT